MKRSSYGNNLEALDTLDRLKCAPIRERGDDVEQVTFLIGQGFEARIQSRSEGRTTLGRIQGERVIDICALTKECADVLKVHRAHPSGGDFDSEREAF